MLCPVCKTEMRIESSRITYEGDESPETETKAFRISTLKCRNKKCRNYDQNVAEVKTQM